MSTQSLPLNVKDTFSRMSHEYNQYTAIQSTYSTMYTHWIAVYRDERNEHTNVKKLEYLRLHTYTVQQCTADKCGQLTHTEYMLWECTLSLPQRPTNKCCRVQLCEILKKSPFRKSSLNIPLKKKREKKVHEHTSCLVLYCRHAGISQDDLTTSATVCTIQHWTQGKNKQKKVNSANSAPKCYAGANNDVIIFWIKCVH